MKKKIYGSGEPRNFLSAKVSSFKELSFFEFIKKNQAKKYDSNAILKCKNDITKHGRAYEIDY